MTSYDDREPARPGHRRKRLPDDVIRERMMGAALETLGIEGGLTPSLDHLSFEEVIQRAAVSRSAAYRIWPQKDRFYDELMLHLAGPEWAGTAAFDKETIDLANTIVDQHADMLATPEGRMALMILAARQGSQQNFGAVIASPQWRTYVALTTTATSMPQGPQREQLLATLRQADEGFLTRMATFYKAISARLGVRLRPEFNEDYQTLAAVGASVVEGLAIRHMIAPDLTDRSFDSTVFSAYGPGEWSLASLGFTAVLNAMVELDPDFVPPQVASKDTKARPAKRSADEPKDG